MCVQRLTVETGGLNERQLTELKRTLKKIIKGTILPTPNADVLTAHQEKAR